MYEISNAEPFEYTLAENDTVRSILQNVHLILTTRRGTVPVYREFGIPMRFLDRPSTLAKSVATVEIMEAIERYEPRAKFVSLDMLYDGSKFDMTVRIEI